MGAHNTTNCFRHLFKMKLSLSFFILVNYSCSSVSSFQPSPVRFRSTHFQHGRSKRPSQNAVSSHPSHSRKKDAFRLDAMLTTALGAADTFWKNSPYLAAALTCGFKASAADFVAQRRQYQDDSEESSVASGRTSEVVVVEAPEADLQRNFVYIVYGAIYQGMAQEYVYNHLYPLLFGSGTDILTVLSKVLFDLLVQTTLVTLPIAYLSKALIYRYSFSEAIRRYVDDIRKHGLLIKYFSLWGPMQCLTFSVIPEHFRVTFIALISFFWVIILSSIASRTAVVASEDGPTRR